MIEIRPATPADVPVIMGLIRELAAYERLAHEVVGDEVQLQAHLFGPKPAAEVLMGLVDGQAVGFALFFVSFSTFLTRPGIYLEDLFVQPSHRGGGLGKRLLAALARVAVERGYGRYEWSVLDWNQPAIDFYRAKGAEPVDGWTRYRVVGAALERLAAECDT